MLASASAEALQTLATLMGSADSDAVRLASAKAILDRLPAMTEFYDLAARIQALEAQAEADQHEGGRSVGKELSRRLGALEGRFRRPHPARFVVAELLTGERFVGAPRISVPPAHLQRGRTADRLHDSRDDDPDGSEPDDQGPLDDPQAEADRMARLRDWHASRPGCWRRFRPGLDDKPGPRGESPPELVVHRVTELTAFAVGVFLTHQRPDEPSAPIDVDPDDIDDFDRALPMARSID